MLTFTYSPWGRVVDSAGTQQALLRYRWTGREFDAETGFYFHRTRYYSPIQRRFVQEDALGYEAGHNLYAYVDGHLFEAIDPDGTRLVDVNGGHGGGGGYNPGRNDMGMTRFIVDPFAEQLGRNLLVEHDADYEAWVAAGSQVKDGHRVYGEEVTSSRGEQAGQSKYVAPDMYHKETTFYLDYTDQHGDLHIFKIEDAYFSKMREIRSTKNGVDAVYALIAFKSAIGTKGEVLFSANFIPIRSTLQWLGGTNYTGGFVQNGPIVGAMFDLP